MNQRHSHHSFRGPSAFGRARPLADARAVARRPVSDSLKPVIDRLGAALLLMAAAPLMAGIALVVAMDGGPVLYRHHRVGKGIRQFACLKFRTMMNGADACLEEYLDLHPKARAEWQASQKLAFDPRITPVGRFLRTTSLDELPQLFNILRGEMSLVGPRPVTSPELSHYKEHVGTYAGVLPGLTGLWQVSGRSDVDYPARVALDCAYVRDRSLWLDLKILLKTPGVVLGRSGAR